MLLVGIVTTVNLSLNINIHLEVNMIAIVKFFLTIVGGTVLLG